MLIFIIILPFIATANIYKQISPYAVSTLLDHYVQHLLDVKYHLRINEHGIILYFSCIKV